MADAHPLFPTHDPEDAPAEVGWIHVLRHEHGVQRYAPRLYEAGELTSLEQIAEWYGGGAYELVAKDSRKARITDRRKYNLPGRSLPLSEHDAPEPVTAAPAPPAPPPDPGAAMMANMMGLMTQIMAQQAQSQAQMMAAVVGALQSPRQDAGTEVMRAALAQQAELFRLALSERGDGTEALVKGMELASSYAAGAREAAAEAAGSGGSSDDLAMVIEGVKAFAAMAPPSPPNGAKP